MTDHVVSLQTPRAYALTHLAHRVILSWGWTRAGIAVGAGAIGALAMPPFGVLPALVVSLTVAVWLLDGTTGNARRPRLSALVAAAGTGWLWGFGYFVAGLWWLGAAFLVEADQFAWALPFGVLGLPAALAFFPALGFALARMAWTSGAARILALAVGVSVSEYLRGHLFTGFPWNAPGMALAQNLWLMQGAALIGLHGLTLLTVLLCASPATLAGEAPLRRRLAPPLLAALALALLAAWGAARIPAAETPIVEGVRLRLMQPNLPQDAKFHPSNRDAIMRRYLALSDRATSPSSTGVADVTHLIWPESAFPFLLHQDARALSQIAELLPLGVSLVTGAARAEDGLPGEERRFYNAVQVLDHEGTITATYDKTHLVPFGEYFPRILDAALRSVGLRQFVHVPGGFEPGTRRGLLAVPGLPPAAATVCYEAIFPGAIVPEGERPGLILNVTNDAWFGETPGPYQHFAQARLRAVEEGLPLVRTANTGISAVVDPYGRVVRSLPLGAEGILDSGLPKAIKNTIYGRFGDSVFVLFVLSCAGLILLTRLREGRI